MNYSKKNPKTITLDGEKFLAEWALVEVLETTYSVLRSVSQQLGVSAKKVGVASYWSPQNVDLLKEAIPRHKEAVTEAQRKRASAINEKRRSAKADAPSPLPNPVYVNTSLEGVLIEMKEEMKIQTQLLRELVKAWSK